MDADEAWFQRRGDYWKEKAGWRQAGCGVPAKSWVARGACTRSDDDAEQWRRTRKEVGMTVCLREDRHLAVRRRNRPDTVVDRAAAT